MFIVCHQTAKGKLNDYLRTYEGSRETSIELVATDNDGGSADALRTIKDKIKVGGWVKWTGEVDWICRFTRKTFTLTPVGFPRLELGFDSGYFSSLGY